MIRVDPFYWKVIHLSDHEMRPEGRYFINEAKARRWFDILREDDLTVWAHLMSIKNTYSHYESPKYKTLDTFIREQKEINEREKVGKS